MGMVTGDQLNVLLNADNLSLIDDYLAGITLPDTTTSVPFSASFWSMPPEGVLANGTEGGRPRELCGQILPADYYDVWRDVKFWCLAFIIPIGLIFNFISLGVFMTSWMRHVVSGRYFMGLALADNLVLIGELLLWLNTRDLRRGSKLGVDFHHSVDFFCKFINFLRYGARMWSSWLTVAITIERFLSVIFPFKIMRLSSPTKAVVVVSTIGVICFSLACFTFFTLEAGFYRGSPLCKYTDQLSYSLWVVVVVAGVGEMVLPSLIVTIFTLLIIWRLALARQERVRMRQGDGQMPSGRRQKTSEVQPTIALIAIAIVFVSIRMPYVIMFFVNMYKKDIWHCLDKWLSYKIYAVYTLSMVLAVLNYAVNFCLYCFTGTAFRTEVRRCMVHRVSNHLLPRARSHLVLSRGRDSFVSRNGSSPAASCPAAPVTSTWGTRKDLSDGDGPMAEAEESVTLNGVQTYLNYHPKVTIQNSPPLWSERVRQPVKTCIVRNGNHAHRIGKNKLRVSHSEEHISQNPKTSSGTSSEQEVVTYGTVDAEGHHKRGRVELKPISRKELANRKCLEYRPLSGIYDPKTETVFFVMDNKPKWRRTKARPLNCFSARQPEIPDFC